MFKTLLGLLAIPALAAAQMMIQVGAEQSTPGGIFQFMPNALNATNGTTVTFVFSGNPGNHSITQSSFANPCQPLDGGFDSGWVFIPTGATDSPTWNLTITNQTEPLWFFCKQLVPSPHCTAGMVGGINVAASGEFSLAAFQMAAEAASGLPGQGEGNLSGSGAMATAPPGPLTASGVIGFANPGASGTAGGSSGSAAAPTATSPSSSASSPTGAPATSGAGKVRLDWAVALLALAVGAVV